MSANTLYLLDFKNYYDRRVAVNVNLGLYLENVINAVQNYNFNPNDGINAVVLVNDDIFEAEHTTPNYLVVTDEENNIRSRWWVIEEQRTRGGQYQYTLYRDVIADYYNVIKQSPCLIEKCSLPVNNPLIFNNEDMTFNQIKTSETLLTDDSKCAWLVAYIAKNATAEQLQGTVNTNNTAGIDVLPYNSWSEFEGYQSTAFKGPATNIKYRINYSSYTLGPGYYTIDSNQDVDFNMAGDVRDSTLRVNLNLTAGERSKAIKLGFDMTKLATMDSLVPAYATDLHSQTELDSLVALSGKYVKDDSGKIYLASVQQSTTTQKASYAVAAGSLFNEMSSAVSESKTSGGSLALDGTPNASSFSLEVTYSEYTLTLSETNQYETVYNMGAQVDRLVTADAEYDIIAVPYGSVIVKDLGGNEIVKTNADLGMNFITSLQRGETPLVVYDIQLVPYCPIQNNISDKGEITVTAPAQYSLITRGADENLTNEGIIFFVPNSTFSTYIFPPLIPRTTSNIKRKINNECDKWRLSAPNFSNYFDFSAEKNGGVWTYKIDCTYKPYAPYIHIAPLFDKLYGGDFNDPRGLICGGDFSLSQVNDAWQTYQLQNKNYQQTFDRQIQNMEITNKYQRVADIASAVTGTGQLAVSGAVLGGGLGAGAGAIAGAVTGTADVLMKEKLRNETLDYTKDLFGYNLGNIQALPLTLTKVSAFNANNKLFPVLEYYTCTDTEKEAFANKLAYNGMTTMVIGKFEDYLGNDWEYTINDKTIRSQGYIKAKPIELIGLIDDYHVASTIAKELDMGIKIELEGD